MSSELDRVMAELEIGKDEIPETIAEMKGSAQRIMDAIIGFRI